MTTECHFSVIFYAIVSTSKLLREIAADLRHASLSHQGVDSRKTELITQHFDMKSTQQFVNK